MSISFDETHTEKHVQALLAEFGQLALQAEMVHLDNLTEVLGGSIHHWGRDLGVDGMVSADFRRQGDFLRQDIFNHITTHIQLLFDIRLVARPVAALVAAPAARRLPRSRFGCRS